eukprot:2800362-Pleurochrysis_carterae.AAC.1
MDKTSAVEQGVLNVRLGDSATAAGAELFAIFAILRKIVSQSGLRTLENVWRSRRNRYRKLQNGA